MNEPQPAPNTADDYAAHVLMNNEHDRRVAELLPANKNALFDALAAAGIDTVTVSFDGAGDSGQIENIEARAGDKIIPLPSGAIDVASPIWGRPEIERRTLSVQEAIETLAYGLLEKTYEGWENHDGAYGEFAFDVADRTITLEYNERVMSSEYHAHDF